MTAPIIASLQDKLPLLPSVDELLCQTPAVNATADLGHKRTAVLARAALDSVRRDLQNGVLADISGDQAELTRGELLSIAADRLLRLVEIKQNYRTRRVINATGVVIHTNLGRAPLSDSAKTAMVENAGGYCDLEFDLDSGKRGKRGMNAEDLLCELTGAEAALIVNNCAAAAFLTLTVHAKGGEVVISRGELVEIGGDFRVPDVLEQSGAMLREVGTTNRTKPADYETAISERTAMILRVHPSNYRIVGFTSKPNNRELAEIAHRNGLIFYEDAGSGALVDLGELGLVDEPVIGRSIADGADIVTFSGDKLLGGPQAGLIVGRADVIERIRRHPLYRALRAGKSVYAAFEASLEPYLRETHFRDVPVLRMLAMPSEEIKQRVTALAEKLVLALPAGTSIRHELVSGRSAVGGGAAPGVEPETTLLSLSSDQITAVEMAERLRRSEPPVIGRIENDRVMIDLRTVAAGEEQMVLNAVAAIGSE
jgi:L-seryl-tRNA(Ser) seleniumtransferase